MSDVESGGGDRSAIGRASEPVTHAATGVGDAVEEGQARGQSADIVRGMVRQAPLLALASAFLMGVLIGRRR